MLKKEMKEMYQNLSQQKEEARETINIIFESQLEEINERIENLRDNFDIDSENDRDLYNKLCAEKKEIEEQYAKSIKEIDAIDVSLPKKEDNQPKINTVFDAITYIETKITDDADEQTIARIKDVIEMLYNSITLEEFQLFTVKKNAKQLKKLYEANTNAVQNILGKNKQYVYPSIYQLKNSIIDILKENPSLVGDNINLSYMAKVFVSKLCMFIKTLDPVNQGIYIFYLLNNIYQIENLPIDKQFEFKNIISDIAVNLMN